MLLVHLNQLVAYTMKRCTSGEVYGLSKGLREMAGVGLHVRPDYMSGRASKVSSLFRLTPQSTYRTVVMSRCIQLSFLFL